MTWTTIPDFATGDIVRAETFQDIWSNLYHLKNPPYLQNELSDNNNSWTITSTSAFADVDTTKLRHEFESYGNDLLVGLMIDYFHSANNGIAAFTLQLDGTALGNSNGLQKMYRFGNGAEHVSQLIYVINDVAAGEHTIDAQWKNVTAGTATFFEDTANKFQILEF